VKLSLERDQFIINWRRISPFFPDIQLFTRLIGEYVPLEAERHSLVASLVEQTPHLHTLNPPSLLEVCSAHGHRLLVLALLINFDENKLGEQRFCQVTW
jgi:hypothetical protein